MNKELRSIRASAGSNDSRGAEVTTASPVTVTKPGLGQEAAGSLPARELGPGTGREWLEGDHAERVHRCPREDG